MGDRRSHAPMNNRLNAPVGYHWTDDEVIYEKNQSLLSGIVLGSLGVIVVLIVVLAALHG